MAPGPGDARQGPSPQREDAQSGNALNWAVSGGKERLGQSSDPDIEGDQSSADIRPHLAGHPRVARRCDEQGVQMISAEAAARRMIDRQIDDTVGPAVRSVTNQAASGEMGAPEKPVSIDA